MSNKLNTSLKSNCHKLKKIEYIQKSMVQYNLIWWCMFKLISLPIWIPIYISFNINSSVFPLNMILFKLIKFDLLHVYVCILTFILLITFSNFRYVWKRESLRFEIFEIFQNNLYNTFGRIRPCFKS